MILLLVQIHLTSKNNCELHWTSSCSMNSFSPRKVKLSVILIHWINSFFTSSHQEYNQTSNWVDILANFQFLKMTLWFRKLSNFQIQLTSCWIMPFCATQLRCVTSDRTTKSLFTPVKRVRGSFLSSALVIQWAYSAHLRSSQQPTVVKEASNIIHATCSLLCFFHGLGKELVPDVASQTRETSPLILCF